MLSLRENEDRWLRSMGTHMGRGKWLPYATFYGADTFEGNEEVIRQSYRNHTENVRAYFSDKPDRYMELKIDGDTNWDVLCQVAQCPGNKIPSLAFPKRSFNDALAKDKSRSSCCLACSISAKAAWLRSA